jgi:hypothetical protein
MFTVRSIMSRVTLIYAWLCPDTGAPVYVGKTSQPLNLRMQTHRHEARRRSHTPKHRWLLDLLARGLHPRVVVLDQTSPDASSVIERRWVRRLSHFALLNMAPAGAGNPGVGRVDWTPEIDALLGKIADSKIARQIGCERKTVSYRRQCLGIEPSYDRTDNKPPPNMGGWNRTNLTADIVAKLGSMPDYKLAEIAGTAKSKIAKERRRLGIPSYAAATGNDGRMRVGEPHRRWT